MRDKRVFLASLGTPVSLPSKRRYRNQIAQGAPRFIGHALVTERGPAVHASGRLGLDSHLQKEFRQLATELAELIHFGQSNGTPKMN